jgi:alkylhydroperoxidase/carboxymuconolactone decarboxylase family protein YurZ
MRGFIAVLATGAATFVARSSMVAAPTGTDEVTSANVARAVAHDCTGCQAIAVAFQAVPMAGNPHTATPTRVARRRTAMHEQMDKTPAAG